MAKSLLIVTGVGYGVVKALDVFGEISDAGCNDSHDRNEPSYSPKQRAQGSAPTPPGPDAAQSSAPRPTAPLPESAIRQLDRMEERLSRIENDLEALVVPISRAASRGSGRNSEAFVTRTEMNAAIEQFSIALDADIERRFEVQNRSVQSLRTMVARTDELLEQVIERIDSTSVPA